MLARRSLARRIAKDLLTRYEHSFAVTGDEHARRAVAESTGLFQGGGGQVMPIMALALAVLSIFVLINSRVKARGFKQGQLLITRVQSWSTTGSSAATTSTSYRVHGTVTTPEGSFTATSIDLYDHEIQRKKGQILPCRYDPRNPARITLELSDPGGIDLQDVVLGGFAVICLGIAWFTR